MSSNINTRHQRYCYTKDYKYMHCLVFDPDSNKSVDCDLLAAAELSHCIIDEVNHSWNLVNLSWKL